METLATRTLKASCLVLAGTLLLCAGYAHAAPSGSTTPPPTATATAETGVKDTEILIGSCSPIDGPLAVIGQQQLAGARAYLSYINDQGGVFGRKIKLNTYNDSNSGEKTYECWGHFMKDGNFAGAFFVGTATASKYVPMAENSHVPLMGLYTGAQLLYEPVRNHVFNVRASYQDEVREQIDHLWNETGSRKIAVIYQDDVSGQTVLTNIKHSLEKYHAAPIAIGSFRRHTTDVDAAIKEVRAAEPDTVILVGAYAPVAEVLKRSHNDHWHPIFTTLSLVGTEPFVKAAGNDAEGTVISQVFPHYNHDELPLVAQYKKLLKKYEPDQKPNYVSFEGFVDAVVMVDALKRAGKDLTRTKFMSALESMHEQDLGLGPKQKLSYGPADHKGFDAVYLTVIHKGQPVSIADWKKLANGGQAAEPKAR